MIEHALHCPQKQRMLNETDKKRCLRIRDPVTFYPGSGSGMNIPDFRNNLLGSILKFLDANADPDPGSGNLFDSGSGIRDGNNLDPGSGINIPDPQHCKKRNNLFDSPTANICILSLVY